MIISAVGGLPVAACRPVKFGTALQRAVGVVNPVKKVRNKELIVTCVLAGQVNKLLKATSIMGRDVSCRQY